MKQIVSTEETADRHHFLYYNENINPMKFYSPNADSLGSQYKSHSPYSFMNESLKTPNWILIFTFDEWDDHFSQKFKNILIMTEESAIQMEIKELMEQKDRIEAKILGIDAELRVINESKNFEQGVVDHEGFPRADVDFGELSNYRNLKRQKAELNNDHLALMKNIEKKLFALHDSFPEIAEEEQEVKHEKMQTTEIKQPSQANMKKVKDHGIDYLTPFAKIVLVEEESPAKTGGLQVGDLVSEFQEVNIYTLDNIKQIPRYVKEGSPLRIVVLRQTLEEREGENIFILKDGKKYEKINCKLVPSKWVGKGLLGCKIDPLH